VTRNTIVLSVDDDPAALELRRILLESAGYSALTAGSGAEALELLSHRSDVDLVLLDYLMPGMNGAVLAGELRRRYPEMRLIAVSSVEELPPAFLRSVHGAVRKGEDPQALLTKIASVLDGTALPGKARAEQTILCVEDEPLQLRLRQVLFESAGFRVLLARSSKEAMQHFRANTIDAVVMDYWLSGKNGTALAEEMKQISPRIPIVMVSGLSSLPGEDAVVDAWLRKGSVQPEDLVAEVSRLIRLRSGFPQFGISE
jgi:CheY-like chemotaxis protein